MSGSLAFRSDGMNRDASLMISSNRSTASRAIMLSAKLLGVCPATISRMLPIAAAIWSIRSAMDGCTSEHFDDIVRDSLREPTWNRAAHGGLSLQSRRVLNDVFDTDKVEERERYIRLDIDKHIDVAVRSIVAPYA